MKINIKGVRIDMPSWAVRRDIVSRAKTVSPSTSDSRPYPTMLGMNVGRTQYGKGQWRHRYEDGLVPLLFNDMFRGPITAALNKHGRRVVFGGAAHRLSALHTYTASSEGTRRRWFGSSVWSGSNGVRDMSLCYDVADDGRFHVGDVVLWAPASPAAFESFVGEYIALNDGKSVISCANMRERMRNSRAFGDIAEIVEYKRLYPELSSATRDSVDLDELLYACGGLCAAWDR